MKLYEIADMDIILPESGDISQSYFRTFDDLWSRREQREFFERTLMGLISETHRKNIERISEKLLNQDYQDLHHFMTVSPWDRNEMNEKRISFIRESRAFPKEKAALILDDTGVVKRGTATEGVGYQYIGQVGKVANGNVFVTSHLADSKKHMPLDIVEYIPDPEKKNPDFRTKIVLAISLIEKAIQRNIEFEYVIADAWYGSSPDIIKYLEDNNLKYIAGVKKNRVVYFRLPGERKSNEHTLEEIIPLLKAEDFRPIDIQLSDGSKMKRFFIRMDLKIKGLKGKRRVIIETDDPSNAAESKNTRLLISNAVSFRDDTVVKFYHLRNWIEVFYREVKDFLGADDYQVRSMERILRHWTLCIAAYSFLQWMQHENTLYGMVKKN